VAALACVAYATTASAALIVNIGSLGISSVGQSINDTGAVVGNSSVAGNNHGFLRPPGLPMQDLGTLGGLASDAMDINLSGAIVGSSQNADFDTHAFLRPAAGGPLQDLGTLGGTFSSAAAINSSGAIVGMSQDSGGVNRAFLRPAAGGPLQDLGTLPGATTASATDINNAGAIVGQSNRAFLIPASGGPMQDLGTLGGTSSSAEAINNFDVIVGNSTTASGQFHAFVSAAGGGPLQDLGTLGGLFSSAGDINDQGYVVGRAALPSNALRAALWRPDGSVVNLDAWLDSQDPVQGSYWSLTQAFSINTSGLITGRGTYNDGAGGMSDGTRAFVLDVSALVPEPAGVALFLPLLALARRERRSPQVSRPQKS
jgi:probable HAF family extracellular repeat protein